jgi:hypothetical protein
MVAMPYDTLDIALKFLKAHPNWFLFPIRRLEKTPPLFKNELELASNDPKQLRAWYMKWPGCNWGIALKKSKLIVVDVDTKPGKRGQQTFDTLELENGPFPVTLRVKTPSGGLHLYYNEANGVVHKMAVSGFGPDVDSTNYVLVPGCWLSNGAQYEIINDFPVADAPAWFKDYLADRPTEAAVDQTPEIELDKPENIAWAINFLTNDAPPSIQGQNGEYTTLMVFGELKDRGISYDKALELVDEYYNVPGRCEPQWAIGDGPLADRLDVKAKNAYTYLVKSAPGAATAEAEFDEVEDATMEWVETMRVRDQQAYDDRIAAERAASERAENEVNSDDVPTEDPPRKAGDIIRDMLPGGPRANLVLRPLDKIDESQPVRGFNDICGRWIWCTGIERFVSRADPTKQWKASQFDSEFNQFLKKDGGASASKYLFKEKYSRIQRFHYLAFRPGKGEFSGTEYNVWRPGPIQPVAGNTDLWNEHINYLFQNEDDRNAVLDWLAWIVKYPTLKPNHALLLIGKNTGTGKSYVARVMEQIIGERNTQRPKNSSMGGEFNAWLKDCRLCIIEEVHQVNRRENFNAMRDLITEPFVEVNIKGISAFKIPNYVCMMGVSNHPEALPLDENDRRWLVAETMAQPREKEYYKKLFDTLPGEFGEPPINPDLVPAVYAELLERPVDKAYGFSRPPETEAKRVMIELSRDDAETWLIENSGNPPLSRSIVTVAEVRDAMPANLQRTKRLDTMVIAKFLKDKLNGTRLEQRVLSDGTRARLWVLRNKIMMIPDDQIVRRYEAERKQTAKQLDESAESAADFIE